MNNLPGGERLTDKQATRYLGLRNDNTLRLWRSKKVDYQPPYRKVGNRVVYFQSELDAYLEANKHGGAAA